MADRGGVSGVALALAAAGSVLLVAGIRNAPPADLLRAMVRGRPLPTGTPQVIGGSTGGSRDPSPGGPQPPGGGVTGKPGDTDTTGARAVAAARKYLGTKYVFGGHAPGGFDCSGLITYVLAHDLGITGLPNQTHTVTSQWYIWGGADTVPWDEQRPGDLVCWMSHIGMVTSPGNMIHAPRTGDVVREAKIWRTPEPIIRRPHAYARPANAPVFE